ncbi:MAG: STAS domain-containing protein [Lentisphaerae bacterium]|jgi:anti-anti-sigma factor|nr:STAS domain-containing protein [Lentisphaerota bacterium]
MIRPPSRESTCKEANTMSSSPFSLDTREENNTQIVQINGPLDSMSFDQFKGYMDPLIQRQNARLVLDCSNMSYINSRGLTLLVRYQRIAQLGFTFFGVCGLNARARKGMKLLGMEQLVKWYPTLEDALAMAANH